MSETHSLFPIPFRKVSSVLSKEDREYILNKDVELIGNIERENIYHTDELCPYWDYLKPRLAETCKELSAELFSEELKWHICSIWKNVSKPTSSHAPHNHVNSFISGILYVSDNIVSTRFHRPIPTGGYIFGHFNDNPGMYNSAWVTINGIQPGDLLLFPSYIVHSVPPNPSDEDRVTIAFNAVPRYMRAHNYTISMGP